MLFSSQNITFNLFYHNFMAYTYSYCRISLAFFYYTNFLIINPNYISSTCTVSNITNRNISIINKHFMFLANCIKKNSNQYQCSNESCSNYNSLSQNLFPPVVLLLCENAFL